MTVSMSHFLCFLLRGLRLTAVPDFFYQSIIREVGFPIFFLFLQVLDLHDNFLATLPADIDQLKSLQVNC